MVRTYTDRHSYLRAVKRHLICPKEERTRLLDTASRAVDAFLEENPQADEAAWRRNLGTPEELAAELMQSSNLEAVNTSFQRHRKFLKVASILMVIFLVCAVATVIWYWKTGGYVEVKSYEYVNEDEYPEPSATFHIRYDILDE